MAASVRRHVLLFHSRNCSILHRIITANGFKLGTDIPLMTGTFQKLKFHTNGNSACDNISSNVGEEQDLEVKDSQTQHVSSAKDEPRWNKMRKEMRARYNIQHSKHDHSEPLMVSITTSAIDNDFFGVEEDGIESSKPLGSRARVTNERIQKKFDFLQNKPPTFSEKVYDAPFGTIRLDNHNKPKYHGQMERPVEEDQDESRVTSTTEPDDMVFEKVKYSPVDDHSKNNYQSKQSENMSNDNWYMKAESISHAKKAAEVDDQYFQNDRVHKQNENSSDSDQKIYSKGKQLEEDSYINSQYFQMENNTNIVNLEHASHSVLADNTVRTQSSSSTEQSSNVQSDQKTPEPPWMASSEDLRNMDTHYFDEQYFSETTRSTPQTPQSGIDSFSQFVQNPSSHTSNVDADEYNTVDFKKTEIPTDLNAFDEMLFGEMSEDTHDKSIQSWSNEQHATDVSKTTRDTNYSIRDSESEIFGKLKNPGRIDPEPVEAMYQDFDTPDYVKKKPKSAKSGSSNDIFVGTKQTIDNKSSPKPDLENPQSAYDIAMKIRLEDEGKYQKSEGVSDVFKPPRMTHWTGAVDSQGFRKLKHQVVNIQDLQEEVVVNILRDSILYENEELVALDKPYGLPSHGGPGVHHSIGKLLPKLAQKLNGDLENLQLIHRLDKETTGVMVVAKNKAAAWKLHGMFKRREVVKKYWMLTKGVPNPVEGVIDIPMAEGTVGEYYRMTLRPDKTPEMRDRSHRPNYKDRLDAITNYKVLDSYGSCALVECQPETGVKHQIRCHMAFALNTPILGDHKYSHLSKLAPQKLYPDLLQRLYIRQPTVRYLAMHLHAKVLILPEAKDGRNLFISARLPKHFLQNMKWLKVKVPSDIRY